jgi:hypothetical protein
MKKSTFKRQQKALLRRREAKSMFLTSLPEPKPAPMAAVSIPESIKTPTHQPTTNMSPGFAAFLSEMHKFAIAYQKLCLRASHRLMVAGLKEGAVDCTNRN